MPARIRPLLSGFIVFLLFAPAAAFAAVPSPPNCSFPPVLIASWDGTPAPGGPSPCTPGVGGFRVVVRDAANLPIAGAKVALYFVSPAIRPHAVQNAGITVVCPGSELVQFTNLAGIATMSVRAAGNLAGPFVRIEADGVILGTVSVISPDYNRDGALSVTDFSAFSTDYLNVTPQPRSDFDNCPSTRLGDLSFFAQQYLAAFGMPPAVLCP